jgi:hypothetical protein
MERRWLTFLTALVAAALLFGACGGGDDDDEDASDGQTPAATQTTGGDSDGDDGSDDGDGGSDDGDDGGGTGSTGSGGTDRTWTEDEARALLNTMLITPGDVSGVWTASADTTTDNAAAAAADPTAGAANERCGRLLGRLLVLMPEDTVERYIGGETVSFFSQGTVYATDEGANDCAIEAAQRFSDCEELAKAFGTIFINPAAVSCVPFDYEQVGDGSFAVGLSGQISAAGTIVELTIKVVAWRQGNVSTVVGMAAAFDPVIDELRPLVDLVADRISEAQS